MDKDLEERLRKVRAIFETGARRFLESKGKLAPPPAAAPKGGSEYAGRCVASATK